MSQEETAPLDPSHKPSESAPERIGPYHILEQLGHGGMGTVYLAEQKEPVRRRVAIKVIKPGMASAEVLSRFNLERQALAVMNHPGIAKVFDAGTTESGQPYFVMEHVEGIPLTKYCDKHRLSVTERIHLFQQVCAAVQHAHQKGVIHRDLKPGNVLVQRHGDRAMPKVIDFGLARATDQQLVTHTVFTEQGQMLGTPEYMSPEQATMDGEGIDTRTDIYSLGVMLYELLCGELPFTTAELRSAGLFEVQRKIREDEPPKPSTKLASAAAEASESALRRRTSLPALMKNIRGDLDWIVMKAMAKEAERRYESANGLAEDLGRHLEHVPVLASPPSAGYRLQKFLRRYRTQAVATALVFVALVVGIIGTSLGFAEAEEQRELAVGEATRAKTAEEETRQRAAELEQVVAFQELQISDVIPAKMGEVMREDLITRIQAVLAGSNLGEDTIEARQAAFKNELEHVNFTSLAFNTLEANMFARALARIDEEFADQPLMMARLLQAEAITLRELGLMAHDSDPQKRALAIRRRELGDDHPHTLASISNMGILLRVQGNLAEAEPLLREALEGRRRELGDDHLDTLTSIDELGVQLWIRGELAEAEPLLREALEGRRRVLGNDLFETLSSMNRLGLLLRDKGKSADAETERYFLEALEGSRRMLGDDDVLTLDVIENLGILRLRQGRLAEAEDYFAESLEGLRRVLGEGHSAVAQSLVSLTRLLEQRGDYLAVDELTFRNDVHGAESHLERMTAIDDGDVEAGSPEELIHVAYHLYGQGQLIASYITFDEAFDKASDAGGTQLRKRHRYNAARAAIRAGCGQGAENLSIAESLEYSRKGRAMLREELKRWRGLIAKDDVQTAKQCATWATLDPDLDCVRDEEALSLLDDDEAEDWRAFWAEVRALLE